MSQFSEKKNPNTFKDFYSNLAADLVNQLPATKKYRWHELYKVVLFSLNMPSDSFKLQLTYREELLKILSNVDSEKGCGLKEIPCRMLKDGAKILACH